MEIKHRIDLHQLLNKNPVVVEIGCAEGLFSNEILQWGVSKLYMVDNWSRISSQTGDGAFEQQWHDKNYIDAMMRVKPFDKKINVLRGISWDMAQYVENESVDLLYLDACHEYECVKKDLESWAPKVKKGGIIAGHDYANKDYGVEQAVHEFCKEYGYTPNLIPEHKWVDAGFWFVKW